MTKTVLNVGMLCVDTIFTVDDYPKEDSKVRAHSREQTIGGNSANISTVLKQLNCEGVVCARIGTCAASTFVTDELNKRGLRAFLLVQEGGDIPASAVYTSNKTGSRTCMCYRGNSTEFTGQEVIDSVGDQHGNFNYDWVHLEHRGNGLETVKLAQHIKSTPYPPILSAEIEKIRDGLYDLMSIVDYVTISKEVCKDLGFVSMESALTSLGPKSNRLIITWGEKGAGIWLNNPDEIMASESVLESMKCGYLSVTGNILHCRVFSVTEIVDSIGAGDSFSAGFIASMLDSESDKLIKLEGPKGIEQALVNGCHIAAIQLGKKGLQI